jgi:hypothetical protein
MPHWLPLACIHLSHLLSHLAQGYHLERGREAREKASSSEERRVGTLRLAPLGPTTSPHGFHLSCVA